MQAAKGDLTPTDGSPPSYHEHSGTDPTNKDGTGSWDAMCTALKEYHCDDETLSTAIQKSNDCCTGKTAAPHPDGLTVCDPTAKTDKSGRSDCSGNCIQFYKPVQPAPPPSPESPSEEGGN